MCGRTTAMKCGNDWLGSVIQERLKDGSVIATQSAYVGDTPCTHEWLLTWQTSVVAQF